MKKINPKRISLILAVIVSSTLMWAVSRVWLNDPDRFSSVWVMVLPALAFIFSAAVASVAFMLQQHWQDRLAAALASWATFIFFWTPDIWYVSALPVFLAFWWFAARDIRHDLSDRTKLRISTTLARGTKLILLGSFLMVSLGFYLLPAKPTVSSISRDIQEQARAISGNPLIGPYVDQVVRTWLSPVRQFIPPILAFALFLTLWSLNVILRIPAEWLGEGIFRLLKRTGFVKIGERNIKAEVIEI